MSTRAGPPVDTASTANAALARQSVPTSTPPFCWHSLATSSYQSHWATPPKNGHTKGGKQALS